MKLILVFLGIFLITACTSLEPVEQSPVEIQKQIQAGTLINIGDKVRIIDVNGQSYSFKASELTKTHVIGSKQQVAIKNIVTLDVKKLNAVKSFTTIPVTIGLVAIVLYLAN